MQEERRTKMGLQTMPKKSTKRKTPKIVPVDPEEGNQVTQRQRKTPAWHRQFLRRLAVHGDWDRAAKESKISVRQAYRTQRASPRFAKAVRGAQRIALQAHADRMQRNMLDWAENGYRQPVVSGGKVVTHFQRILPSLSKMVAEVTVPMFREAREQREKNKRNEGRESVSNTLNVSIMQAHADNPVIRAALLAISEELTRSTAALPPMPTIDVTPTDDDA